MPDLIGHPVILSLPHVILSGAKDLFLKKTIGFLKIKSYICRAKLVN